MSRDAEIWQIVVDGLVVARGYWRAQDGSFIGANETAVAWALAGHRVTVMGLEGGPYTLFELEPIRPVSEDLKGSR